MKEETKLNILFLCDKHPLTGGAGTLTDHIEAFEKYSKHSIWFCSNRGEFPTKLELNYFDVIVLHYSLHLTKNSYLNSFLREKIKAFKGLKVVFVQDEYRTIDAEINVLSYLEIDILYTCFSDEEAEKIYPFSKLPKVRKVNNLTGYITEDLLKQNDLPMIKDRPIDVGYRARKCGYWLGELSFEKWDIVEKWNKYTLNMGLINNISYLENDRIYGDAWLSFIKSCKVHLGVESGASVMDFTGEIEKTVSDHMKINPNDDFYSVQNLYLKEHEGRYKLNQISPRCFEAIALKTALVLYEGEYSNILEPWKHYIPLKKDFSNIETVVLLIKDNDFLQKMVDKAYNDIGLNSKYSYKKFIEEFDNLIFTEFQLRNLVKVTNSYTKKELKKLFIFISIKRHFRNILRLVYLRLPNFFQTFIIQQYQRIKTVWF